MPAKGWDGEIVYFLCVKLNVCIHLKTVNFTGSYTTRNEYLKKRALSITSKFPVWIKPRAIPKKA